MSMLTSFKCIRLGHCDPHPQPSKGTGRAVAIHFRAAWQELSPRGYTERAKMLGFSDGCNFEKLGV